MNIPEKQTHAVTGAFGFTGRYLAARLLDAGRRVITLTGSPGRANPFGGRVAAFPFDFERPERMAEALRGTRVLYNSYWVRFNRKDPGLAQPDHRQAVLNSLALFKAAKQAGVERIVQVSIAHADAASPLPYYRGKGQVEAALLELGIPCSIVRPAVLFGPGSVLVNNLAWTLRRFPICFMFGKGNYHLQPVFIEDLADILLREGEKEGNSCVYALGPDDFVYRELLKKLGLALGHNRPLLGLPAWMLRPGNWLLSKILGEPLATADEVAALTGDLLHVAGAEPTGKTPFLPWVEANLAGLGREFIRESSRRRDRNKAY